MLISPACGENISLKSLRLSEATTFTYDKIQLVSLGIFKFFCDKRTSLKGVMGFGNRKSKDKSLFIRVLPGKQVSSRDGSISGFWR